MGKLHYSPFLPIDLERALDIYPALDAAADDLTYILQGYQDVDRLFKRHFLDLFIGPDDLSPADDRAWASLIRLRDLARRGELITGPFRQLELNNDRARLVCDMLALILKL